jgi:hypothetical protein
MRRLDGMGRVREKVPPVFTTGAGAPMKKSKTKHPCHDCDGCTYEHAALHERVAKLESRVPAIEVMQRFDWNKMRTVLDRLAALERALKPSLTSSPC